MNTINCIYFTRLRKITVSMVECIHFNNVDTIDSTVLLRYIQSDKSSEACVLFMTGYSPTLRAPIVANVINKPLLFNQQYIGFMLVRATSMVSVGTEYITVK